MTRSLGTELALCALVGALAAGGVSPALAGNSEVTQDNVKQTVEQALSQMPLPEEEIPKEVSIREPAQNELYAPGVVVLHWGHWGTIHTRDGIADSRGRLRGSFRSSSRYIPYLSEENEHAPTMHEVYMISRTEDDLVKDIFPYSTLTRMEEQQLYRDELFKVIIPPMNRWETQYLTIHWESK